MLEIDTNRPIAGDGVEHLVAGVGEVEVQTRRSMGPRQHRLPVTPDLKNDLGRRGIEVTGEDGAQLPSRNGLPALVHRWQGRGPDVDLGPIPFQCQPFHLCPALAHRAGFRFAAA